MKYPGRKEAYTQIGISRVPCSRCGKSSNQQWQACSYNRYFVAICKECDIELNRLVLEFLKISNKEELMKEYTKRLE